MIFKDWRLHNRYPRAERGQRFHFQVDALLGAPRQHPQPLLRQVLLGLDVTPHIGIRVCHQQVGLHKFNFSCVQINMAE